MAGTADRRGNFLACTVPGATNPSSNPVGNRRFSWDVDPVSAAQATIHRSPSERRTAPRRHKEQLRTYYGKTLRPWWILCHLAIHLGKCSLRNLISTTNVEAWHPLPGAPLRFRLGLVATLRLQLGARSGLPSAGLFDFGLLEAMSHGIKKCRGK
jgi:hypothetical protein